MKNKTRITLERFETSKYRMIVEGMAVGILTGLLVSLFRLGLERAEAFRGAVLIAAQKGGVYIAAALGLLAASYIAAWYCSRRVPLACGSGIPQVKGELLGQMEPKLVAGYLRQVRRRRLCHRRRSFSGKGRSQYSAGGYGGKRFFTPVRKAENGEKMLMTCGAGAGLSGAFCAPLAGVVFSLEELHKNFSTEVLLSTMAASVTSDFVSSYIFGLSPVFRLSVEGKLPLSRYWMILLLGIFLGVLGVFYNWTTAKVQDLYDKLPRKSCG